MAQQVRIAGIRGRVVERSEAVFLDQSCEVFVVERDISLYFGKFAAMGVPIEKSDTERRKEDENKDENSPARSGRAPQSLPLMRRMIRSFAIALLVPLHAARIIQS